MGCKRLDTDFLFFLEVETSEERARTQKKDLNVYPFGLKHKGYNNTPIPGQRDHKYGFGGKEEQNELGLEWIDITARNYDPALGRWMNIDPLAEQMRRHSPYNYAFDNPIRYLDADGMEPTDFTTGDCEGLTSSSTTQINSGFNAISTILNPSAGGNDKLAAFEYLKENDFNLDSKQIGQELKSDKSNFIKSNSESLSQINSISNKDGVLKINLNKDVDNITLKGDKDMIVNDKATVDVNNLNVREDKLVGKRNETSTKETSITYSNVSGSIKFTGISGKVGIFTKSLNDIKFNRPQIEIKKNSQGIRYKYSTTDAMSGNVKLFTIGNSVPW